jgi:UDP-N-acetylglucosamine--N-acetylmuramyl-(pentapeptide) pyrophosphoryl-undecaprenol N-acetylglucosamine transferase
MIIRIFFTGGATGGHLLPIQNIINEIKKTDYGYDFEFYWVGPKPKFPFEFKDLKPIFLPDFKIRRYFSLRTFLDFLILPYIILKIFFVFYIKMPNIVFSKGGSVSFFVNFIAYILNIPVLIHESDSIPGLSNKFSSFFAETIFLSFKNSIDFFPKKVKNKEFILVGHPIDEDLFSITKFTDEDYEKFKIDPNKKTILILGGSQGAQEINDIIFEILKNLIKKYQIIHITGKNLYDDAKALSNFILKNIPEKENYHLFDFVDQKTLAKFYSIASLVISRAGSGTIFEVAFWQIPSILIPLKKQVVGIHQIKNALEYLNYGACRVIESENLKPNILLFNVDEILQNQKEIEKMKLGAKNFYIPGAKRKIVEVIIRKLEYYYGKD